MPTKKCSIAACFFLTILFWSPFQTPAYVLQGPHILSLMSKKIGRLRSLKVVQQLTLSENGSEDGGVFLTETLRYVHPERFRSDIEAENVRRVRLVSGKNRMTVVDGRISEGGKTRYDIYTDVLLYRSRPLLQDRLLRQGVDVWTTSLGRFDGRIAYVIGAQYPDESVSQLWIEKETFRPMRWLIVKGDDGSPSEKLDIRYLAWQNVTKIWYPSRIEIHRDDKLTREIDVRDVSVDPVFSDNLFDVSHLRSQYRSLPHPQDSQAGEEEMSEVQKAIEEFKGIYE